jgi:nicotinamide mononucleotide transporter
VSPLELLAAVLGLAAVWLLVNERMAAWPLGISTGTLYIIVFAQARLYAGALLQVFYVALQVYGWISWRRGDAHGGRLLVRRSPRGMLGLLVALGAIGTLALGTTLARFTDQAVPYWDSFITAFSLVAQWMVARKLLENWAVWFIVDLVAVGVYVSMGLAFTAALYLAYLGLAIAGWRQWQASLEAHRPLAAAQAS